MKSQKHFVVYFASSSWQCCNMITGLYTATLATNYSKKYYKLIDEKTIIFLLVICGSLYFVDNNIIIVKLLQAVKKSMKI